GRKLMRAFLRDGVGTYEDGHDDLAGDRTSRLSAYIRWGCVSPLELAREAGERRGGAAFVRQLCWRDFHHQVLAATPSLPHRDYPPRRDRSAQSQRGFQGRAGGRN